MSRARTAVVTIVSGRDAHLQRQRLGLADDPPDLHVVVAMGTAPEIVQMGDAPAPTVVHLPVPPGGLPLARARNTGAQQALGAGCEVLIFLDVDCIPGTALTSRYRRAVQVAPPRALVCGPVTYLPPPPADGYPLIELGKLASPHPGRPTPPADVLVAEPRLELFWSLSFACSAATWSDLGGFDEAFVGYGAEDTDFALRSASIGASLHWAGGVDAYHQHHPPSRDDPQHIVELVGNAERFFARHGIWPMADWLDDLAARGLVEIDTGRGTARVVTENGR